jgi:hypothetical protein
VYGNGTGPSVGASLTLTGVHLWEQSLLAKGQPKSLHELSG